MLDFSEVVNLTTSEFNTEPKFIRDSIFISCEPDGSVNQFYIHDDRTSTKNGVLDVLDGLYEHFVWSEPFTPLTTQRVVSIGIKNFPGVGSIGFYNLLDEERSGILSPVFVEHDRFTRPTLNSVSVHNGTVSVSIQSALDIEYEAYRFVMRNENEAFEYITYETLAEFKAPYKEGTYECYCIGYKGEGEAVSLNSNIISVYVDEDEVSDDPASKRDIYVKATELTTEGYIKLILSNDTNVVLNVGMATQQNVSDSIQTATDEINNTIDESIRESINDTWEASY